MPELAPPNICSFIHIAYSLYEVFLSPSSDNLSYPSCIDEKESSAKDKVELLSSMHS